MVYFTHRLGSSVGLEHSPEERRVVGSIPTPGTKKQIPTIMVGICFFVPEAFLTLNRP